jgi:hypothetical protein
LAVDLPKRRSDPIRKLIATNDFACAQPARTAGTTLIAARFVTGAAYFCRYRRRPMVSAMWVRCQLCG